jgi:hypothetical protein
MKWEVFDWGRKKNQLAEKAAPSSSKEQACAKPRASS